MAAIVRVKRKIGEDPAEALVLHCKRQRCEQKESAEATEEDKAIKSTLRFAGTVQDKTEVSKQIRDAIRKEKLEKEYKQHAVNIASKSRSSQKSKAESNRFQAKCSRRALNLDSLNSPDTEDKPDDNADIAKDQKYGASSKVFCLYDVEPEKEAAKENTSSDQSEEEHKSPNAEPMQETVTCNNVPMVRKKVQEHSQGYVYDLYFTNSQEFDFRLLENILTVEALGEELQFHDYRDEECEVYDDDEDSNEEDNWRNDYPDEDPRFIENENAEYMYGEDGCVGFDDEVQMMSGLLHSRCVLGADGDSTDEENLEDSDQVWTPRTYEKYKEMMLKELGDDYKDDF